MKKRVAIGMISHESNSFSPVSTPRSEWETWGLTAGADILTIWKGSHTPVGAFLDYAEQAGWEVIPTLAAQTLPSKPTDAQHYRWMKEQLLAPIEREQPDGVLLFMHGAMMAEGTDDVEGDICRAVKGIIGDRPLILAMDLHGNITPEMCAHCDGVFAFDTNPHIDLIERATEAAACMEQALLGTIRPVTAHADPPHRMLPPTINMRTAEGPMAELFALARQWEERPGILNVSVFGGFPYCDFSGAGLSIVATADGDSSLAAACATAIAAKAWEIRDQFLKEIPTYEAAVRQTLSLLADVNRPSGPIILADVADNPTGGGAADTTVLLHELLRCGVTGVAVACIHDPETVEQAISTGLNNTARFTIGGRSCPDYGAPLEVVGTVLALTDGRFTATSPVSRGEQDMGPTAVIETGGLKLVITTHRRACIDTAVFTSVGIDPAAMPVLVIKSRGHFRASFEPIASSILEVDAPGPANPSLHRFPYRNIPRPVWPLDEIAEEACCETHDHP
ncbi:microcystin degradation protein MlrC [Tumebacillus sp. BK434]|uniref:M81 family metallopeptidase n=1 Tax=Tumebacillus sp. BK434 TaxID=2512169 RepID=UPI0010441725|nr:M81 family metallopeptidase [Tumebacillus sp. BK434]TCP52354.1 microcystin degradation protein MlrC [Tumebacillus sp. BK434]